MIETQLNIWQPTLQRQYQFLRIRHLQKSYFPSNDIDIQVLRKCWVLKKKGLIGLEGGFCLFMNKYFICNQKYNFEISNSYLIFKRKYPYEGRQGVLLMMSPSVWPIKYLNRPWNCVSITSLHIYYLGILRGGEKILIINHQQDLLNMRTHTHL